MANLIVIEPEPTNADVISALEHVLARARAGELSSVAIAAVSREGCASCTWSSLPSVPAMLGAISRMVHKLNLEAD